MDMGYELIGADGKELHINVGTSQLLTQLTAGWWPLIGLPDPICKRDCQMLARVLTNYAHIQEQTVDDCFLKVIHWPRECGDSIKWLKVATKFFSASGPVRREH